MAEVGRFSQRISLEGLEEIKKGLEEIGLTGSKAFKEVDKAIAVANKELTGFAAIAAATQTAFATIGASAASLGTRFAGVGTAFANVGSSLASITSSFLRFGAVITGIGAVGGIAGATAALIGFTKASVEAGDEVNKTSQALGLSVEQYQALGFAAAQAGVDQQAFGRALTNLNKLVQDGVKEQKKALFEFFTDIQKSSGTAVRSLDQLGPTFQQILQAAKNLQQQGKALGQDVPLEPIIRRLTALAETNRQAFDALTVGTEANRTALQKLGLEASSAGNALVRLGIPLIDLGGKTRGIEDILGDLADQFQRMPDGIQKSALASEIFGDRIGRRLIPLLNGGRAGLKALRNEFSELVTGFSPEGAKAAEDVNDAFSSMFRTITNVRNQLAVPLFKPLETAAKAVQQVLLNNRRAIDEFGRAIARNVIPIIEDFVRLISGQPVETNFFKGIISGARQIENAFKNIIGPAIRGFLAALEFIAEKINKVFGTELTGTQIGIALLVGQLTGLNNVLIQVGIAFGVLALALAANPFVLLAVAVVAAIAVMILNWDRFVLTITQGWDLIAFAAQRANERIIDANETAYAQATAAANAHFAAVKKDFQDLASFVERVWQRVIDLLTKSKEIGGSIGGNIPGMEGAPFARGGFVRGAGTATSDSILARLSSGEFVVRAAAVRHWGADFFAALNALRTPRFDMGGLVAGLNRTMARNFAVPGFAMGGPAIGSTVARGDLRPVIINIGGRQVAGLFAPPDVVQELRRAAISEQYLSAGRKA